MHSLTRDIRYGFRNFLKWPGFTAIAIVTLALGIGANTAIFSLVNTVLLRPLAVLHPEQLVEVYGTFHNGADYTIQSYLNYKDYRDRNDVFSGLMAYRFAPMSISHESRNERVWGYLVSGNYFEVLCVQPFLGRYFMPEEDKTPGSHPVAIISYGCWQKRFASNRDIVGQALNLNGHVFTVIGVAPKGSNGTEVAYAPEREIISIVGDVRHESLDIEPGPEYYVPYTQAPEPFMSLVVRSAAENPANLANSMRESIKQVDKDQYVAGIRPMTKLVAESVARRRFNAMLTGLFAMVALLLASVGIFGVLNYIVAQRTQEIGLRVCLGAQTRDVLRLVLGQGVRLILLGLTLGLAASFALTRVLTGMLFGVTPTDPSTFVAVSFLLTSVALLACYIPARRATKVDPLVALRYE